MSTEIHTNLEKRIRNAMLAKDKKLLVPLRNIKGKIVSEAKNQKVDFLEDSKSEKIIQKYVKERKEALAVANKADRPDLAEQEQYEIDTLSEYLPEVMSEDETRQVVLDLIEGGAKNIGMIMGKIGQYGNSIDRGLVSRIAKESLK